MAHAHVKADAAVCTDADGGCWGGDFSLPGNFYTLTAGSNEKRWNKMKPKLDIVAKSFYNIN
jgi:hypothetical protein